jgi:hypothetical protein
MKNKNLPIYEVVSMAVGELLAALAVCLVFLALQKFSLSVLLGSLLGATVIVLNFTVMMISVNRAVDKAMAERGDGEMDDEAAEKFAKEHTAGVQSAVKLSYILRTLSIAAVLIVAFVFSNMFNVIATAIPLLLYQPILMISQLLKRKEEKNG